MNIRYSLPALLVCMLLAFTVSAQDQQESAPQQQDSTGLPGDNFSLQGALDLFKKAASPEEFEKLLNTSDNKVNNLDLNGDGTIDYIRVINKKQDDVNVFILQDVVSETESQDIAVINLQKNGDANAIVQIEGDRDIYGTTTIAEPEQEGDNSLNQSGQAQPQGPSVNGAGIIVNVWFWPCVRFVYAPAYTVWVSPFTWVYHPVWWHPWRPLPWVVYRPYRVRYVAAYPVVYTRRIQPAVAIYRPVRVTSVTVINRNRVVINNYRASRPVRYANPARGGQTRGGAYANPGRGSYRPGTTAPGGRGGYQPGTTAPGGRSGYQPGTTPGGRSGYQPGTNPGGRNGYQPGTGTATPGGRGSYQPGNRPIAPSGNTRVSPQRTYNGGGNRGGSYNRGGAGGGNRGGNRGSRGRGN